MKKTLLYLSLFVFTGFNAKGQVTLTKNWEIKPAATGSLIGVASLETTIAYNRVTNKLYLPERNNKISILNPDGTLSSPSTLATLTSAQHAGWGSAYKYTKIRVTADGVIYACNMTLSAGTAYIYRWASENDANPTVSAIAVSARTGDSFAVSGTGANTIIYLSGSGNNEIYVCNTVDGVNFTLHHKITGLGGSGVTTEARSSISPVSNSLASDLWINTLNVEARRISSNSAGTITESRVIVTSLIDQKYSTVEYFEEGGEKYLAVSGAHDAVLGMNFKLYKITAFPNPTTAVVEVASGTLTPGSYTTNANAYADVTFVKNANGTYTFYHLSSNNGLASYTTSGTLPVSLTTFNAALQNGQSKLIWSTSSESNNKGFEILRSTDGMSFEVIGSVPSKAVNGSSDETLVYDFVDVNPAYGLNYYRLNQVDLNGGSSLSAIKSVDHALVAADVVVYPNPTTEFVNIRAKAKVPLVLRLYDLAGKELVNKTSVESLTQLSLQHLSAGIYILKISDSEKVISSTKINKQ